MQVRNFGNMFVSRGEVWVTSVLRDAEVEKALILCNSLKRVFTTRPIAVLVSKEISSNLRQAMYDGFNFVFHVEEDRNTIGLEREEFAKIYSLAVLHGFETGAYLPPTSVVLKNCDKYFEMRSEGSFIIMDSNNASGFLFKPSIEKFNTVIEELAKLNPEDRGLGKYLLSGDAANIQDDIRNGKCVRVTSDGQIMAQNELDISIVHLGHYADESTISKLNDFGILGRLVAEYWSKIQREDVLPLIRDSSPGLHSASNEVALWQRYVKEPIAVVGMSCRYPGSNSLEEFWDLLVQGQDGTSLPPSSRWSRERCSKYFPEAGKTNAGFLKTPIDEFDSKFFGISPKESAFMDPQHRLLLELVWEGLEDACIDPENLRGTSGTVFMGSWLNDYKKILVDSGNAEFYRNYMGNSIGAATARISHHLGMTGPSVSTESGCSSAMVAVHLATQSLRLKETNLALACGVNLLLEPFELNDLPMIISPDGRCKTFSADANGFARAEGGGVLVLKRMSDAMADGDRIWGLIRGSAITQEGLSESIGTPTVHSESVAMKDALRDADLDAHQVSYIEAHGTGTVIGDTVEIAAIGKAYNSPHRVNPLIIGSVKTNVGHTESASGIAGIMKVILSMHNEIIPAHQNFKMLSPTIDLGAVPAILPLVNMDWKKTLCNSRIAGVSAFGITGTDAHVIIAEPPEPVPRKALNMDKYMKRPSHILSISTKSTEAMNILLKNYATALETSNDNLADIAHSVNTGRSKFPFRVSVIGSSKADIRKKIKNQNYLKGDPNAGRMGKTCFLFTGQGSQYPAMAKQFYWTSPIFRIHFDHCERILKTVHNIDIKSVLWSDDPNAINEINRTIYSQTSIFCVEYGVLKMWESLGIKPDYVLGHSLGEFAAAVCAGILSVEDALMLVAERSKLIDNLPASGMLVIRGSEYTVENAIRRFSGGSQDMSIDIAAVNSCEQTVVSGDSDLLDELSKNLTDCNNNPMAMKCVTLNATHAFHSRKMDPILEKYGAVANATTNLKGQKPGYISGLEGDLISADKVDSDYWVRHTREKVNFLMASRKAVELGCNLFIEIGPQPVLSAFVLMNNEEKLICLPSIKRNHDEWATFLNSVGMLFTNGVDIHWSGLDEFFSRKKVRLPHYPFIRKRCWPDMKNVIPTNVHPLLGSMIDNASSVKLFQNLLDLEMHRYIMDHTIGRQIIFPAAGYLEMCLAAGITITQGSTQSTVKCPRPVKLENLTIVAPLSLDQATKTRLQTVLEYRSNDDNFPTNSGDITIKIYQQIQTALSSCWVKHATAAYSPAATTEESKITFDVNEFHKILSKPGNCEEVAHIYENLAAVDLQFGTEFKSIEMIWRAGCTGMVAKVKSPSESCHDGKYIIHPVIIDAMIQAIMMHQLSCNSKFKLYVPIKIGKFVWLAKECFVRRDDDIYIYVKGCSGAKFETNTLASSAYLLDSNGEIFAVMSGVELVATTLKLLNCVLEHQKKPMPDLWQEIWRPANESPQHPANLEIHPVEEEELERVKASKKLEQVNHNPEMKQMFEQLAQLAYYYMLSGMMECGWNPLLKQIFVEDDLFDELKINPQFRKQFGYFLRVYEEEGILQKIDDATWSVIKQPPSFQDIKKELASSIFNVDLVAKFRPTLVVSKIGQNLKQILRGKLSALTILFPSDTSKVNESSAEEIYKECGELSNFSQIVRECTMSWFQKYIAEASGQSDYVFRILEIGAGTGGYTKQFLEILENTGISYEYTYTDISAGFFTAAEKKFQKYIKNIKFQRLNIEEDPIAQGFVPISYDLICASDVIHATKNIKDALTHVNILLKENGHFDLCEITLQNRFLTYVFGLLDGFWRFEDFEIRKDHCVMSSNSWRDVLESTGFSVVGSFHFASGNNAYIKSRKVGHTNGLRHISDMPPKAQKYWLVFQNRGNKTCGLLAELISQLPHRNVIYVSGDENFAYNGDNSYSIRPSQERDFHKLLEMFSIGIDKIEGLVYGWSLENGSTRQEDVLCPYLYLTKALLRLKQAVRPRLYLLTSGVASLNDSDMSMFPASTLWGFTKSLRNENDDLFCKCIDMDVQCDKQIILQIFYELWKPAKETLIAFRGGKRYIAKLEPHHPNMKELEIPAGINKFHLVLPESKLIADLKFAPLDIPSLDSHEIVVEVKAAALNFRDVLSVIKPSEYFKDSNSVGFDIAGVVKSIGSHVTKWAVGDGVYGVNTARSALPSHIKLHEEDALTIPKSMTFAEASTLPVVVCTSVYCLLDIAKISPSDKVLIHAASGGVGISAIQICKYIGATVIATAGSTRKQNFLRSLGVNHVFNSRNTDYEQDILKATNGHGVDVVLNSLTSEGFKEATLNVCADGARFVEMGQLSIWKPEEVASLRPDVKYFVVDLTQITQNEWRRLLSKLEELTEKNAVRPIPYTRFDAVHIQEALTYLQKAKHIGKVVCVMPEVRKIEGKSEVRSFMFNTNATYIITGGLGGIGFEVCKWMVKMGARYVLLVGRNVPNKAMLEAIFQLNSAFGSNVTPVQVDISSYSQCMELFVSITGEMGFPEIRGIMHAAGALDDGLIQNQTWEKMSTTLSAKVEGTLNLHELTKNNSRLEHFVLFSSMAALFGSPGQSNHSAANSFQDTFAHYRHSIGLPATSINWGQWGQVGVATEVDVLGIKQMSTLQGINALEYALNSHHVQIGAVEFESFSMFSKLCPSAISYVDTRHIKSCNNAESWETGNLNNIEFMRRLDAADNLEARQLIVKDSLKSILRSILKLDSKDIIEDTTNFQEMGVDSLMFVEIKNSVQTLFGDRITVSTSIIRDSGNIKSLADALLEATDGNRVDAEVPTLEEISKLIRDDCILPQHIMSQTDHEKPTHQLIANVLLTGATGALGPYILAELCKNKQITQITCLIRAKTDKAAAQRLENILMQRALLEHVDMERVNCVTGDVTFTQIGLESEVYMKLCDSVDAVFNCAASVQHTERYISQFKTNCSRSVNMLGLNNVLEFCCSGRKLKHIYNATSLVGVASVGEDGNLSEQWPEQEDFDGVTSFAYPITKFVGDMLMKEAITNRGIPGKVFRFPLISGDSVTGRCVLDRNHCMLRYVFGLKNGMIASSPFPVPVLPVDVCAKISVALFFNPDAPHDVYNITNCKPDTDQKFVEISKRMGYNVKIVEYAEFSRTIREAVPMDSPLAALQDVYADDNNFMSLYSTAPSLKQWLSHVEGREHFFTSKKLLKFMPEFYNGGHGNTSSMEYIYNDFVFAKQHGWLAKYGL